VSTALIASEHDPCDIRLALCARGLLGEFNAAGVLAPADVHVAMALGRLGGEDDETTLLGAALAARAPRLGHVCADLATIRGTITVDRDFPVDLQALRWPKPGPWIERLAASPLVARGRDREAGRALRLVDSRLYLDRYWTEEQQVAAELAARSGEPASGVDPAVLRDGLDRLFEGEEPDLQRLAAASAVLRRLAVVAGGPGTGKTTTVARILALLDEQAAASGRPPPRMALAAPTGKAAARLEEAVRNEAASLDVDEETRSRLLALSAATLHRLLGWRPGSRSRFRHHRGNWLPHDVVVVDETSMVSLSLMARLVEAVRPAARLVLVGDPQQLASVEAGAVLGDIIGPASAGVRMRSAARQALADATGHAVPATDAPPGVHVGDGIIVLRRPHRFRSDSGIAALARAVQGGDADAAVGVLREARGDLRWIDVDVADDRALERLAPLRDAVVAASRRVTEAAAAGAARDALSALGALRLLCAHRRGPYGVARWGAQVERWLAAELDGFVAGGPWYPGRPLLVTENDYGLRLYNGDTGVVVAAGGDRLKAVFERRGTLLEVSPTLLSAVETVHAMTVHKSQGSQFDAVALLLPDPASPILTRELLYTAVTRAKERLTLIAGESCVRAAVTHPISRASGLRDALWSLS
jgi:exodeoxyribonuclease V alpha subunit